MPVDFTNKKREKSNYEYLQEILKGNNEGLDFLDGFKHEKEKEIESLRDEVTEKEGEIDEKNTEITNLEEEKEYEGSIDTRLGQQGDIRWSADNIACKSMMEELDNAISRGVSIIKIENVLRAL